MDGGVRYLYEAANFYRYNSNLARLRADPLSIRQKGESIADTAEAYRIIAKLLDDPNTKRILFDSRQASLFADLDVVEEAMQEKLHAPFPTFYMEFTEPVQLPNMEPGWIDSTRAYLLTESGHTYTFGKITGELMAVTMLGTGQREDAAIMGDVSTRSHVDRSWKMDLQRGTAVTEMGALRRALDGYPAPGIPTAEDGVPDSAYWPVGMRVHKNRPGATFQSWGTQQQGDMTMDFTPYVAPPDEVTWYEAALANDTALLSWCIAYTMAKSIVMVEEWEPRGHRRRLQREGKIPQPWHVVKVDPKIILNRAPPGPEGQIHHSFRYDVIGHLRFGHHPRKDGTFSDTIEWVAPHQRGLANSVYIPKTYKVDRGKPLMIDAAKGYFGKAG